jgi:hypothetical protein
MRRDPIKSEVFGVRLTPAQLRAVETLAAAEDRSPADMVRVLINRAARDLPPAVRSAQASPDQHTRT